jgi:hypothetical protein
MKSVTDSSYSLRADTKVLADGHRFSWWAVACRREPVDRTRAIQFVQLERLWRRDDVAVVGAVAVVVRDRGASRRGLPLNVEDLELENHRARVRFQGGDVEWLHLQARSARLLPCLIEGRSRGPLFLSDGPPVPARRAGAAKHIVARLQPRATDLAQLASRFATHGRGDGGHVWLPLRVSADSSGASIVGELIEQIEAIRAVAEGA